VRQRTTIRSNSPRPPNTRGAHRPGLASIEDDNWEEQPNSTNPSHKGRTFKNTHNSSAVNNNLPLTTNNASYKQQTSHEPPSNGNNGGPANTLAQHDYYHSRGDHRHHNHSNADNSHDDQDDSDDSSSYSNSDEESDEDDDNNTSSPYNTTEENEETDLATSSNHIRIINHHSRNNDIDHHKDKEEDDDADDEPHERTSLLPPSGISTNEYGADETLFKTQRISNTGANNIAGALLNHQGNRSHKNSRNNDHHYYNNSHYHPSQHENNNNTLSSSTNNKRDKRNKHHHPKHRSSSNRDHHHRSYEQRERKNKEMEKKWEEKRRKFKKSKKNKKKHKDQKYYRHNHNHHHRGRQRHRDMQYSRRYTSSDSATSGSSSTTSDSSDSSSSSYDYKRWAKKKALKLERERAKLIAQWKEEARLEAEAIRREEEARRWYNRFGRWTKAELQIFTEKFKKFLSKTETFISNLPLTIGAVALAIVTLGVVWFKFAEENIDSCEPVHFHSPQCTFPEFPGCFDCDLDNKWYKIAVNFHYVCSTLSGILAISFFAKILLARRVVIDEMSSPTTSSPAGLICMTMVCVFAGRGWVGQVLVSLAATMHLCLVIWYIYMALAYHILPEPSWYPNTVGVGLSAVKTWLYYPLPGHFLMAISLSLNFFFFPISLIRVALNNKISAPVCWIQMSAPSISLYALTIMAQPSFQEDHPDVTKFQQVHRMVYLPCMHFLFILCLTGFCSSVQSLWTRWDNFKKKEFSPAHAAFCFPTLAHANAVQAYRGAIDAFSDIRPGSPFKILIYTYWVLILVGGTITTVIITAKFFYCLPTWTQINVDDEVEPPAPSETLIADVITTGETLRQNFVSPAVLQANETGVLVRDGRGRYVRTRKLTAIGFEPMMSWSEMAEERDALLDWVEKNPARRRKRTLSVPGIDFINNYKYGDFGTNNQGVYDDVETGPGGRFRRRAQTSEGHSRQVKSSVFY